jgi:hypothetical protein
LLTYSKVNELSNTIDLSATLLRAEALFIRFRRTVEAIDKKANFPAPHLSLQPRPHRTPSEDPAILNPIQARLPNPRVRSSDPVVAPSSESDARSPKQRQADREIFDEHKEKQNVITSELRDLLSRRVSKMDKTQIRKHGGGIN